jgi:hypothetical protein
VRGTSAGCLLPSFKFRLAPAVRLATTLQVQPLDLPQDWTHGQHRVSYEEIALRLIRLTTRHSFSTDLPLF